VGEEEFETLAKDRMTPSVYSYVAGWAGTGATARGNRDAFWRHVLRPRAKSAEDARPPGGVAEKMLSQPSRSHRRAVRRASLASRRRFGIVAASLTNRGSLSNVGMLVRGFT